MSEVSDSMYQLCHRDLRKCSRSPCHACAEVWVFCNAVVMFSALSYRGDCSLYSSVSAQLTRGTTSAMKRNDVRHRSSEGGGTNAGMRLTGERIEKDAAQ